MLTSFLLDQYGSRKTGLARAVTGGGSWVVEAGTTPLDEMIADVKAGVLITRFSGGRPNDKGDFSGIAKNSYYIEDGAIAYPISETMVSGNMAALLTNIVSDIDGARRLRVGRVSVDARRRHRHFLTAVRWRVVIIYASAVVLGIVVLAALYSAYAYQAYNRVVPGERPCVDCTTRAIVNGFELYYREVGEDHGPPPVVLAHGGPGHSSLSFKNAFDFLEGDRRVVYYDQRGSGNSQIRDDDAYYTVDQLVDELEALRREVVKADRIVAIGHSFGSALAQRYALKYPEHVDRLMLIGGIRINNGMSNRFVWKWLGPALYSTALGLPPADSRAADAWFTKSADSDNFERLFDGSRTNLLEGTGTLSFAPWRDISLSLVGYDYRTELARLQIKTMFIYGAADSPYTGKPAADEICSIIPHCTAVGFDRSGHWPFLEEPERFQRVMREFLNR